MQVLVTKLGENGNLATDNGTFGGQTMENGHLATENGTFGGQTVDFQSAREHLGPYNQYFVRERFGYRRVRS